MTDRRKTQPSDPRMSYVQNILHSVQLRRAPTLEEFFQGEPAPTLEEFFQGEPAPTLEEFFQGEPAPTLEEFFQGEPRLTAAKTTNLHHSNICQVLASQNDDVTETKDSLPGSSSPPTRTVMHDGKAGILVRGPPMTSTAYGAFTTNHLPTLHNTTTVLPTLHNATTVLPTLHNTTTVLPTLHNTTTVLPTLHNTTTVLPTLHNTTTVLPTLHNTTTVLPTLHNATTVLPTLHNTTTVLPTLHNTTTVLPTLHNTTTVLPTLHNTTTVRDTFLGKLVCDPTTPSLSREATTHTNRLAPQTETRTRERLLYDQDRTTNVGCVLEEDLGLGRPTVDPPADISQQSSGYVTYENMEATCVLSRTEAGESIISGPEEGTPVGTGGFFLQNTSDTNTTKACNIISHPPVDAEDLEEGSSPCDDDLITGRPVEEASVTSSWCNDVIPDYLEEALVTSPLQSNNITCPVEDLIASHPGKKECSTTNVDVISPQHQASLSLSDRPDPKIVVTCPHTEASTPDLCKPDQNQASDLDLDPQEGPYRLSLQTLLKKSQAALERPKPGRNQPEPKTQTGDVDLDPESEPLAGPYRLSLQTLLKKSQEHRRRQRQLKNQAKASTCPGRTQEASTHQKMEEEISFSDKENDEFPQLGRVVAEGLKTRDRDGGRIIWEWESSFPDRHHWRYSLRKRGFNVRRRRGVDIDAGSAAQDIQLHLSPDVTAAPSTLMDNLPHPISADASITQESFYLVREKSSTLPRPSSLGGNRFQTVPTPQFSMSPIRCKSKGNSGGGGGTPKRQILVNTPLNVDNEVGSGTGLGKNDAWDQSHLHRAPLVAWGGISQGFIAPIAPVVARGGTTPMRRSSDQAEQIAQLELNLSSLKALISDLESTLTETPGNHQTHNSSQTDNIDQQYQYRDYHTPDSQALQTTGNQTHNNSQTDNSSNLTMDPPHKYIDYHTPESQTESNLTDSDKGRGGGGVRSADKMVVVPCRVQWCDSVPPLVKEVEISVTTGYKRQDGRQQQPLAAHQVTSLTQKMRVPDVFRKVPYDVIKVPSEVIEVLKDVIKIPASHKTTSSVLSDASNNQRQPMEWKSDPEDHADFLSINQSYDVDTPSGLWLQGGSGSEGSLKGHDPAGKQLTPENGEVGQGGASRAKRRLVMHTTEENGGRGGGRRAVMVRPHSSTPKAAVRSHGQENQQVGSCSGQENQQVGSCSSQENQQVGSCSSQENQQVRSCSSQENQQVRSCSSQENQQVGSCSSQENQQVRSCSSQENQQVRSCSSQENQQVRSCSSQENQQVGSCSSQENQQVHLELTHAAQIRALKEEQRRQQQQLLQMLAIRYQLLQSLSFPVSSCPTSSSRLEDNTTSLLPLSSIPLSSIPLSIPLFSPFPGSPLPDNLSSLLSDPDSPPQSSRCLSVCYRPLVAAAVKGYLTRRLLRTERVGQLLLTIKDTQQFLQAFQPQSPGRQDLVLLERVTLQVN
ncbi:unnamed protein product [Coregonus sp. 'balchen']|nr:unnamed protein product [Coregonus sp. 'balchen']